MMLKIKSVTTVSDNLKEFVGRNIIIFPRFDVLVVHNLVISDSRDANQYCAFSKLYLGTIAAAILIHIFNSKLVK